MPSMVPVSYSSERPDNPLSSFARRGALIRKPAVVVYVSDEPYPRLLTIFEVPSVLVVLRGRSTSLPRFGLAALSSKIR